MADHRSLTVRLPSEVYFQVASLAQADEQNLNSKFNQLILLGLDRHISLDAALRRLLGTAVVEMK
jgi:hypothetical protein